MLRIGTWNTEWTSPRTDRGKLVRALLADPDCDILCVTEGTEDLLPDGGHLIDAGSNWGYPIKTGEEDRRKVILWSKRKWIAVRTYPERPLAGRFVAATTRTEAGPLNVVGVCIPWLAAHVSTSQRDRKTWDEHVHWLREFERVCPDNPSRTIVLGDFNQSIPRRRQKKAAYEALRRVFQSFTIRTAGWIGAANALGIDHIAHTTDLIPMGDIGIWPKRSTHNRHLSDHFGVWCDFDDVH